jgi:hypothetical protein
MCLTKIKKAKALEIVLCKLLMSWLTSMIFEQNGRSDAAGGLTIVPCKNQGGFDFLRKLFLR